MERIAVLHRHGQKPQQITPENGKNFTLQELYKLCECDMIQAVPLRKTGAVKLDGKIVKEAMPEQLLLCDEDGKLKADWGQRISLTATQVWERYYGKSDVIVGPVVICHPKMLR